MSNIDVPFYTENTFLNRCRGCNNNLNGNDPASRYQKLKLIQNTVRVPSSLYTMNLGALNVYEKPDNVFQMVALNGPGSEYIVSPGVNWNQMSDRRVPHVQKVVSGSGSTYGGNSLKRTLTRLRPGALSPGGYGVDIKHNSYDRYLARIKGKAPLRRGPIPKTFASPYIPFNLADPVYGGKLFKTAIVSKCNCPIEPTKLEEILYENNSGEDAILNVNYTYHIGDIVYAPKSEFDLQLYEAKVLAIEGQNLVIEFTQDAFPIIEKTISKTDVKLLLFVRCRTNTCIESRNISSPVYYISYVIDNSVRTCQIFNYYIQNVRSILA